MTGTTAARIASEARVVVVAEGSAAVSMRRLATAVGVTPMAIYRHYPNREALLAAVADAAFAELAEQWEGRVWADDQDLESHVAEVVGDHLDLALGTPRLYSFLFTERRDKARRFPEDFQAGRSPTLNLLAAMLTEGIRRGLLRECDVWEVALVLAATIHGLVQLYDGGRIALPEPEFRGLCEAAVWRILDGITA
ncbi:MAG: TetR family transcriptional regulator [Streptosporangiales bacterium]|nr:TetR family transcriptional regulator [Streptosporangiales bacterium]